MKFILPLLCAVILLVLTAHQVSSKPAAHLDQERKLHHEQVRRRWNGAKRLFRRHVEKPRRVRKQISPTKQAPSADYPEEFASILASNASGSAYIVDRYIDLSTQNDNSKTFRPSDILLSDSNTIRTLQDISPVQQCNMFNFSLSVVKSSEYILHSELHLYITRQEPPTPITSDKLYVVVLRYKMNTRVNPEFLLSKEISTSIKVGWTVFELPLEDKDQPYAAFQVQIFPNRTAYLTDQGHLDCASSPIKFQNNELNKQPYLTIQSYDPALTKVDYKSTLNSLEQSDSVMSTARRRRQSPETGSDLEPYPVCQPNQLVVQTVDIPLPMPGQEILHPKSYNAGICGGVCGSTLPRSNELKHSQLVHLLRHLEKFEQHQYTFTQCCAPIRYRPLYVILSEPSAVESDDSVVTLAKLPNMRIDDDPDNIGCECLEVIEFGKTNSGRR